MRIKYENVSKDQLIHLNDIIAANLNPVRDFFVSPRDRETIQFILNGSNYNPEDFEKAKLALINQWLVGVCKAVNQVAEGAFNYELNGDTITFIGVYNGKKHSNTASSSKRR